MSNFLSLVANSNIFGKDLEDSSSFSETTSSWNPFIV